MKGYYVLAAVIVIACIALGASSFKSSMTPYVEDFAQVKASKAESVQVVGNVVKGKTTYNPEASELVFFIKDTKGKEMQVDYRGTKPGNFEHADRVVVAGQFKDGAFKAEKLLVKCPSKYKSK